MEELFKNKTKYSNEEYNIFLNSYEKEYALSEFIYMIFYSIFLVFCIVLGFINQEYIISCFILIVLIIYISYKIIMPKRIIRKERKSKKFSREYENIFTFYKKFFKVSNPDGKSQIFYFKLYRVVETNSHFYLYISRDYAFIISKKGFIDSTAEDFSKFIRKKVIIKYKNRKNKMDCI